MFVCLFVLGFFRLTIVTVFAGIPGVCLVQTRFSELGPFAEYTLATTKFSIFNGSVGKLAYFIGH